MITVLEQSSGERSSSSLLDKYPELEHLLFNSQYTACIQCGIPIIKNHKTMTFHPLFYITTSCSIYTNKHNYNQLSNIEHMYIYLELLIPFSHHQIPLWHTLNIPIFLHYPPSGPRPLSKNSSTERFTPSRSWKDPNSFSQQVLYVY